MASTKVFENASQFTIQGSEFNAAAGNLTVNHIMENYVGNGPSTQLISGRRFRVILDGDVFVLNTRASVSKDSQDKVKVVRSISTVQVVGIGESRNFTAVTYEGPQAKKAFEDDLVQYSQSSRHHSLVQLFGVVHGVNVPALILHGELIPLWYFAKKCSSSPLALAYLSHRFDCDAEEARKATWSMGGTSWFLGDERFWMQPTSGLICLGPLATSSNLEMMRIMASPLWDRDKTDRLKPQLDFALYTSDRDIIKHIEDHYDSVVSFVALLLGNRYPAMKGYGHLFTFGSVMSRLEDVNPRTQGRILAQMPLTSKVTYTVGRWIAYDIEGLDLQSSGWTRVSYTQASKEPFGFHIQINTNLSTNDFQIAWLAQAQCILENIEHWNYVLFSSMIELSLEKSGPNPTPIFWSRNMYLFIAPVNITEIDSTPYFSFHDQPYFWSFDENGAQKISHTTQDLLGLPLFEAYAYGGKCWSTTEHKAVSQYLRLKGFSSGVQYCRKHGYPLFKAPKNTVENDGFEIIESVSDDTGDDWELISEDTVYSSSDVPQAQWLPWSKNCINSHSHNSDCAKNHKAPKQRLRRSRSLSSFNPNGIIQKHILHRLRDKLQFACHGTCSESPRVHPALQKPCPHWEHRIRQSLWRHGCIPLEDMDFCLNLIDY